MKALDTILKGNTFEEKIYELLKELLDNEEFFVSGKRSKIFWKKDIIQKIEKKHRA